MAYKQTSFLVNSKAVRTSRSKTLEEQTCFTRRAVSMQWKTPDRVRARHGNEEELFIGRKHQTIRADPVVNQGVELAARRESVYFSGWIGKPCLTLVGEVQIAGLIENKIIGTFEMLKIAPL